MCTVTAAIESRHTAYQDLLIVDTKSHGRSLILDGRWQSSVSDEFLYHEPLVHPACVSHGGPRRVLVLGGGEGAAVREALKWETVERVVMVDIDGEAVEVAKKHLPQMHQGAFDYLRTQLVIGDALEYLDATDEPFDVIVNDLSDPIENGPSEELFTAASFELVGGFNRAVGRLSACGIGQSFANGVWSRRFVHDICTQLFGPMDFHISFQRDHQCAPQSWPSRYAAFRARDVHRTAAADV